MCQDDVLQLIMYDVAQQLARLKIRQMARLAPDTLLQRPWIGSRLQHGVVMVGLEHKEMASSDPFTDKLARITQIRHHRQRPPAPGQPKSDGVISVMGQGKGIDHQILEQEWST